MAGTIADREEVELLVDDIIRNFPTGKVPLDVFMYLRDFPREIRGVVLLINQGTILEPPSLENTVEFANSVQEKWLVDFVRKQFPREMLLRKRVLQILEEKKEVPRILPTLFCRWTKRTNIRSTATPWEKLFGDHLRDINFNERSFPIPENRVLGPVQELRIHFAMSGPRIEEVVREAGLSPCDVGCAGNYIVEHPSAQRDRPLIVLTKWANPKNKALYVPVFGVDGSRMAISLRPFEGRFASGCAVLCESPKKL